MKSTSFKETNFVLGAGNNPNTEDLPACVARCETTGRPFIFAKFKLTPEELEKINQTGCIYIGVMGTQWPPLLPTPHNPFDDFPEGQKFVPYEIDSK